MKTEQTITTIPMIQINSDEKDENTFNTILTETVDEVFTCLGNSCKHAIYFFMEHQCALPRTDIPERIQDFSAALEKLLGPGATLIEIEIMKRLRSRVPRFKYAPAKDHLSFEKYVSCLNSFIRA